MLICSLFCVALLAAQLAPVPDVDALDKATAEIESVFGSEIKSAKSPSEKSSLASDMIRASETEDRQIDTTPNARYDRYGV